MRKQPQAWKDLIALSRGSSSCIFDLWKGPYAQLGPNCVIKRVQVLNGEAVLDISDGSIKIDCPNTPAQARLRITGAVVKNHAKTFVEDLRGCQVQSLPKTRTLMIGEHCVVVT